MHEYTKLLSASLALVPSSLSSVLMRICLRLRRIPECACTNALLARDAVMVFYFVDAVLISR